MHGAGQRLSAALHVHDDRLRLAAGLRITLVRDCHRHHLVGRGNEFRYFLTGAMSGSVGFDNRGVIAAEVHEHIFDASLEQRLEKCGSGGVGQLEFQPCKECGDASVSGRFGSKGERAMTTNDGDVSGGELVVRTLLRAERPACLWIARGPSGNDLPVAGPACRAHHRHAPRGRRRPRSRGICSGDARTWGGDGHSGPGVHQRDHLDGQRLSGSHPVL